MKKLPIELMPKDKTAIKYLTLISQIGLVMVASILIFFFLGYFFGQKFHLKKIAIPIGILIGVFAGFYSVYNLLKRHFEKDNDEDR